ncbi:hypothetical protein [Brevundimonas sp.]|jgi:hypothetical protein|uniref:hypothetical protein n=1 Tax=Brevundimonas sp. TaxID=1871086 RepID=UPI003782FCE5
MIRTLLSLIGLVLALTVAAPAMAQVTVQRTPSSVTPALGQVIRGSSPTTFSISTAGVVTRTSGDAIRVTSGNVTPPTIVILCQLDVLCNLRNIRVTVQVSGSSGIASITNLRVSSTYGLLYYIAPPVSGSTITFETYPIGLNLGAAFAIGMDVLVPPSGPTGYGTYTYTVTAVLL